MKNFLFVKTAMVSLAFVCFTGLLLAQTVSFNVAGTNPRCQSQYPLGVPYSGMASVSTVEGGGRIKSVTFQIQRWLGNTWGFWGGPFTISPGYSTSQVNYSNTSPGATQLTVTPINQVRMRAIITYFNAMGGLTTVTVYSPITQFNYFPAPSLLYQVNELTTSPTVPINVFLCAGGPLVNFLNPPTMASGTGVQWRLLMFESTASGGAIAPFSDFESCPWQPGTPSGKFLVDEYGNGCHRPGAFIAIVHEYLLIRIELRNDCGTVTQDALIHLVEAPSSAQVDFDLGGSTTADAYFQYGPDDSPSDAILSSGGSFADPTWAGGASTHLAGYTFDNFNGGLLSWTVSLEDVTAGEGAGQAIPLGSFGGPGTPPIGGIFFNNEELGYDPNNRQQGFFITNFNALIGKKFKVTLTGNAVCNLNPSKSGYFKLIPGGQFWLVDPNKGSLSTLTYGDDALSVYPNPTRGQLNIDFSAEEEMSVTIQITDINGRIVRDIPTVNAHKGLNSWNEDINELAPGNYVLQVISDQAVTTRQFSKLN